MVQVFLEVHHVLWLQSPDTLSLFALVVPTKRIRFLVEQSLSCFLTTVPCPHFPVARSKSTYFPVSHIQKPSTISTGLLHGSHRFHTQPIQLVVSERSY